MRFLFASLILISVIAAQSVAFQEPSTLPAETMAVGAANPIGHWRVKFFLAGLTEKNLVIDAQSKSVGSFLFLDAGPDDKTTPTPLPGAWSLTTNHRVSFSSDVELPIGTCCREVGTLILKGTFSSNDAIAGKAIFITSTIDEENFNGFRSTVGTFTATRAPNHQ